MAGLPRRWIVEDSSGCLSILRPSGSHFGVTNKVAGNPLLIGVAGLVGLLPSG